MFLEPKKVETKVNMINRGEIKITRAHVDKLNRKIREDCEKTKQQHIYRGD